VEQEEEEEDAEQERQHFESVVRAFADYRRNFERRIVLAERRFDVLPPHMKGTPLAPPAPPFGCWIFSVALVSEKSPLFADRVPTFNERIKGIRAAGASNQVFLSDLVQPHVIFENDQVSPVSRPFRLELLQRIISFALL